MLRRQLFKSHCLFVCCQRISSYILDYDNLEDTRQVLAVSELQAVPEVPGVEASFETSSSLPSHLADA